MIAEVFSIKPSLPEEIVMKPKRPVGNGPTRSRNLWSKKSTELYTMMTSILSDHRPIFVTLNNLQPETYIGMINTFIASPTSSGTLERIHSNWSYFNKSFILTKVSYNNIL